MRIVVIANGTFCHQERLIAQLDSADLVIAADGGGNWLRGIGRAPDLLVGDLDSISPSVLAAFEAQGCHIERHRPDKDETDTELALLAAVARGASEIVLLGALGGRIDHELANVQLLAVPFLGHIPVYIYDGLSFMFLIRDQADLQGQAGDLLSLMPWGGDANGIVTQGLRYPLAGESLLMGPARGVSNVLLGPKARVSLDRGQLLAIHTPLTHLGAEAERTSEACS